MTLVGGVDGCRGGWVVVTVGSRRATRSRVEVHATFADVIVTIDRDRHACVGVDMPVGLPDSGARACDTEARARLGPRRSTLFPTPPRALLGASDYTEALARSRRIDAKGISVQAFNLLGKMAEVDAAMTPARQSQIFECHPESCFAALAGTPFESVKRTAEGQAERTALLLPHFPDVADHLASRPKGAQPDDVLDAFAVAWSARRHQRGASIVLGDGAIDARGLRMQLVI